MHFLRDSPRSNFLRIRNMKINAKRLIPTLVVLIISATSLSGLSPAQASNHCPTVSLFTGTSINLGLANDYGVLAGAAVTNGGSSYLDALVGVSPGTAITGIATLFEPGSANVSAGVGSDPFNAQLAVVTANSEITRQNTDTGHSAIAAELGGQIVCPGIYQSDAAFGLTGELTLEGGANDVFIFITPAALTSAAASRVTLNGVNPKNVYWQLGAAATLGASSVFAGNILAQAAITTGAGVRVNGRLFAQAAITLDSTTITVPTGSAFSPTFGTPTPTVDGFTVQISNFSSLFEWAGAATASGTVSFNGSGLVTVTGVAPGTSSTLTISNTRIGYAPGTNTVSGNSSTIAPASQTITFDALSNKTYGDPSLNLSASTSSGLPITYVALSELDACAVSGNTVTITGAGTCSITASQVGNGNYNVAESVTKSFLIAGKSITVKADNISMKVGTKVDPMLTYVTTGLVNITDQVSGKLKRDSNNANDIVGTYTIRQHNLSYGKNYVITYVSATFTITN